LKKKLIVTLATLLLIIGNVIPVLAAEDVTVEFTTDKNTYTAQDKIIVLGKVLRGTEPGKGTSPTLMLKNPSGKLVEAFQWEDSAITSSGQIGKIITLGKDLVDGTYVITLSALNAKQVSKEIHITGYGSTPTPTPQKELKMSTNKVEYKTGEAVDIAGSVTAGGNPQSGLDIIITAEKNGTKIGTDGSAKTGNDGNFHYSYTIPSNTTAGKVTIKASLADRSITVSKDINVSVESTPPPPPPSTDPTPTPPPTTNPTPTPDPTPVPIPKPVQPPVQPDVNKVTSESTVITGNAEKGTTIAITDKNLLTLTGKTDANGHFSIPLGKKIKAGTKLYVTSIKEEMLSKETIVVVVEAEDRTPPVAPEVKDLKDNDKIIKGKTEAGAKLTIKVGNHIIATGTADQNGMFSIQIKEQKAGTVLTVIATDRAGNVSKNTMVVVEDATPPSIPTISSVTSTKIIGKAEAGTTVYVKVGKTIIGVATVNSKGNYSVSFKQQKAGTNLSVYAKDKAGNIGKSKMVIVPKK